ncbi:hypothetical protein AVEN_191402-1 [Araneus ventricosus]|uniref:Uncharacterized protein n=1 Tax=Araneus ventricosus TaxID=182803 RepID=A0A4Y2RAM5_ARAVE|nr:hypothetical protein AVEN_191402-1 [Araneus ventricosus]
MDASQVEKINGTVTCVPTIFGFALQCIQSGNSSSSANILVSASDVQLLWELETLGIRERTEMNAVDKGLIDQFNRDLKFKNGRCDARLTWKTNPGELGNNFSLAKKRFDELRKGFLKNEWIANAYRETIREQEMNGIIEECSRDENEYFMPHRDVLGPIHN